MAIWHLAKAYEKTFVMKTNRSLALSVALSTMLIGIAASPPASAQLDKLYQKQQEKKERTNKLCLLANAKAQYWHSYMERNAITILPSKAFLQTMKDPYSDICIIKKQGVLDKAQMIKGEAVLYRIEDEGIIEYTKGDSGEVSRFLYGKAKYEYSKENKECQDANAKAQYRDPVNRDISLTYIPSTQQIVATQINPKNLTCKYLLGVMQWTSMPSSWKGLDEIHRVEKNGIFRYTKDGDSGKLIKTIIGLPKQ